MARLAFLLLVFVTMLDTVQAETVQKTVTLNSSTCWGTTYTALTETSSWIVDGVTVTQTPPVNYRGYENYVRNGNLEIVGGDGTLTFSVTSGNIVSATIVGSTSVASPNLTPSTGSLSSTATATSTQYTWTGSTTSLTLTATGLSDGQEFAYTSIELTLEDDLDNLGTTTDAGATFDFTQNATFFADASLHAKTIAAGDLELYLDSFMASDAPAIQQAVTNGSTYLHMQSGSRLWVRQNADIYINGVQFTTTSGYPDVTPDGGTYDSTTGTWTGQEEQLIFTFNSDADIQIVEVEASEAYEVSISSYGRGYTSFNGTRIEREEQGTTYQANGTFYMKSGDTAELTFTPDDRRYVYQATYYDEDFNDTDITDQASAGSYTLSGLTGNSRILVYYNLLYPMINYRAAGGGSIQMSATYLNEQDENDSYYGDAISNNSANIGIAYGADVTFTLAADEGYKLARLEVNGEDVTSQVEDNTYTYSNLTQALDVTATFEESGSRVIIMSYGADEATAEVYGKTYCPESGESEGKGQFDGAFDFTATAGTVINMTFEPATGCQVDSLVIRTYSDTSGETEVIPGTSISGLAYSVNILESMTQLDVAVYYGQIVTHTVKVTSVGQGTVNANTEELEYVIAPTSEADITVNDGNWLSMTFTPETGYRFSSLTIDGQSITLEPDSLGVVMYTIPEVTADMAVVATFEEIPTVATPTMFRDGRLFALTTETENATIYFAVDDGSSATTGPDYQVYSDAETHLLDGAATIYAYATKANYNQSETVSFSVTLADMTAKAPSGFAFADNTVTLTVPDSCAVRYTTDGTDPTAESTLYESGITVTGNVTVRARSFRDNWFSSDVVEYTVDAFQVADVTFAQDGNQVTLTCDTPEAVIHYSLSINEEELTGPSPVVLTMPNSDCTITAYATRDGYNQSEVTTYPFVAANVTVATPTFARTENVVTISTTTAEATIYYTTDSTDPTTESTIYTEGITADRNMTIKAFAVRDNWFSSAMAEYTVDGFQCEQPVFSWNGDQLTMTTATEGATISYSMVETSEAGSGTPNLQTYTGPITVTSNVIIVAVATMEGYNDSEETTLVYPYTAWKEMMDAAEEGQSIVDNYFGNAHVSGDQIIALRNLINSATSMYFERTADEEAINAKTAELQAAIAEIQALLAIKDAYAVLSENTLTFYYDNQMGERGGMSVGPFSSPDDRAWNEQSRSITTVAFDESFADYTTLTSTAHWFNLCVNLTTINGLANLKTDAVTDMSYMFSSCSFLDLAGIDLSGFNTANVTNMHGMFISSGLTSIDLSTLNTSNVTDMGHLFEGCTALTDVNLSGINTEMVTDMSLMFYECSSLQTIYVGDGWSTVRVTDGLEMFTNCIALVGINGTTYDAAHVDADYAHVDGGERNPGYLSLLLTMGDANGDGEVNIADAVATVTNILGEDTEESFYRNAADMNADIEIDIFDVTLIVNEVLNGNNTGGARGDMTRSGSAVTMESAWLTTAGETAYVSLDHAGRYTALQFDLTLPEGTVLEDVRLLSGATDHQLSFVHRGDGDYRVVGLSMSNSTLPTANGHLLQLRLSQAAGEGSIALNNILLVTPAGQTATAISETLSGGDTATSGDGTYYDLSGRLMKLSNGQLSNGQLSKGIYIVNHKKVIIK